MSKGPHGRESPLPAPTPVVFGRSTPVPLQLGPEIAGNQFDLNTRRRRPRSWRVSQARQHLNFPPMRRPWETREMAGFTMPSLSVFWLLAFCVLRFCMATLPISLMQSTDSNCCRVAGLQNITDIVSVTACDPNSTCERRCKQAKGFIGAIFNLLIGVQWVWMQLVSSNPCNSPTLLMC